MPGISSGTLRLQTEETSAWFQGRLCRGKTAAICWAIQGAPSPTPCTPGILPVAGPQRQGKHLLSHPLGRTQYWAILPLRPSQRLRHTKAHFPPPGPSPQLGPPHLGTHPSFLIPLQFPSAHHGTIALHSQPRLPRPVAALILVPVYGFPVPTVHQGGGPFRLFQHYFSYAAAVQLHSVLFLKLPAGPLE